MKHLAALVVAVLATSSGAQARMVECQTETGWYGAARCDGHGVQVPPHNLIAVARQCVTDMDEAMRRERAIGRESGYVNAALLHEATRRKHQCQRDLAEYQRQVKALSAVKAASRPSAPAP